MPERLAPTRSQFLGLAGAVFTGAIPFGAASEVGLIDAIAPLLPLLFEAETTGPTQALVDKFMRDILPNALGRFDIILPRDPAQREKVAREYFERLCAYAHSIRYTRNRLVGLRALTQERFVEAFPRSQGDYATRLGLSLFTFRGAALVQPTMRELLLGVDSLALASFSDDELQSIWHHEMFHLHHAVTASDFAQPVREKTVAQMLWFEGLACVAARLLHPAAPLSTITGSRLQHKPSADEARALLDVLDANVTASGCVAGLFAESAPCGSLASFAAYRWAYAIADEQVTTLPALALAAQLRSSDAVAQVRATVQAWAG